ncbi:MAG: glycoside hydrolase family 3 C-terminal domain-containing protein [Clostridiales bacterium]|nr:glycoside hydrolase family 3 C-terminal domain-containing protein [Clostridiales bacterium]
MVDKYSRFRFLPCLPLGRDGKRVTGSEEHIVLARKAAGEGMVLLKNINSTLPLQKGAKVALFGKATMEYTKGGGGSSDVNCAYIRTVYDGFAEKERNGFLSVFMPLVEFYEEYVKKESANILTQKQIDAIWDVVNNMEFCRKRDDMTYDTFQRMHVKEAYVPDELIDLAGKNCDTAVITLSRFSAEGTDRRVTGGDYLLSELEISLIDRVCKVFSKVIVVYNTGAVTDCEPIADDDRVGAILYGWQAGMEGPMAIADILCGFVNPSGKLPDTVTKSYESCPSKDDYTESLHFLKYSEDIFVGYRYYETLPGKLEEIRYPFGFGLSYTSFEITNTVAGKSGERILCAFNVKNTGKVAGKEVVQLYFSAPQGKLGKPARQLAAFKKTKLLMPGEEQCIALKVDISSMASFDNTGAVEKNAWVLEKGEYELYLGTSSLNCEKLDFSLTIKEDTVTEKSFGFCAPRENLSVLKADGSFYTLEKTENKYYYGGAETEAYVHTDTAVPFDEVGSSITLSDFVNQFTVDEMKDFVGGHAPTGVANTGCFGGLKRLKVPAVATADGPAGLRLSPETGIPTTCFPCATLLAATWNEDLLYEVGAAAADEIRENNIGVWLAPAVNIHRNPLCGRNFEYMSEDPLLAGRCTAAEIRGIQSRGVAVSLKHFACNSKEINRYQCDSMLSERALREIYLRPFEIAVKESDPFTIMSSYNKINGIHTSESWELLTGILRKEWGFKGMVVTDWGVKNDPVAEVKAGNDMKMHCGYPDDLQKGLDSGVITPDHLKVCVMRILDMFTKLAEKDG